MNPDAITVVVDEEGAPIGIRLGAQMLALYQTIFLGLAVEDLGTRHAIARELVAMTLSSPLVQLILQEEARGPDGQPERSTA